MRIQQHLKQNTDPADLMERGRLFQSLGATTAKARSVTSGFKIGMGNR